MQKKKVLVTDRFHHDSFLTLQNQKFLDVQKTHTPDLTQVDLSDVHGLVIRSRTAINEDIFKRAPQLQVIITATSGFDHIDLKEAERWGVTVMFTPEANAASAAQLTWTLVLACCHKLNEAQKMVRSAQWNRELITGTELQGKTYGIIGLGRIGQRVASLATAFGMKVMAYDPYADDQAFRDAEAERVAYEEVLKHSDVLSFHVPKTSETQRMLNRSHFEYINRGIILINTSRGQVVHEPDLIEALDQGWIGACGLDVYEKEPLPKDHRLLKYPQLVLTPHVGASTFEAFAKASEDASLKLIRFFIEGSASDTLPPKASWYGAVPPWKNNAEIS